MVLRYDVGRLLSVAGTASQLAGLGIELKIPRTRFTVNVFDLPSSIIQTHLISIGGHSYISNLSGSVVNCGTQDNNTKCYNIRGNNYLAIKSDGIGIVDIAFEQQEGRPQWILDNSTEPFIAELSQIRCANLQNLRIVRDTLKCRAIIPSNRGPEPYFREPPFPQSTFWVRPGVLLESKLVERQDPIVYFIRASYTPFTNMTCISFHCYHRHGISGIYVNDPKWEDEYSVTFTEPPTVLNLKFVVCQSVFENYFPWVQFNVNNQWAPAVPIPNIIVRETLVKDAVGL